MNFLPERKYKKIIMKIINHAQTQIIKLSSKYWCKFSLPKLLLWLAIFFFLMSRSVAYASFTCAQIPAEIWNVNFTSKFVVGAYSDSCTVECNYQGSMTTEAYDADSNTIPLSHQAILSLWGSTISHCEGKASCPAYLTLDVDTTNITCDPDDNTLIDFSENYSTNDWIKGKIAIDQDSTSSFISLASNSLAIQYGKYSGSGSVNMSTSMSNPAHVFIATDSDDILWLCQYDSIMTDNKDACEYLNSQTSDIYGNLGMAFDANTHQLVLSEESSKLFLCSHATNPDRISCSRIDIDLTLNGAPISLSETYGVAMDEQHDKFYVGANDYLIYKCSMENQGSSTAPSYSCSEAGNVAGNDRGNAYTLLYDASSSTLFIGTTKGGVWSCTKNTCVFLGSNGSDKATIHSLAFTKNGNVFAAYNHNGHGRVIVCQANHNNSCSSPILNVSNASAPILSSSEDGSSVEVAVDVSHDSNTYTTFYNCDESSGSCNEAYNFYTNENDFNSYQMTWLSSEGKVVLGTFLKGVEVCDIDNSNTTTALSSCLKTSSADSAEPSDMGLIQVE